MITITFFTLAEKRAFIKNEIAHKGDIQLDEGKAITVHESYKENVSRYDTESVE